jgi:hypothetical protein
VLIERYDMRKLIAAGLAVTFALASNTVLVNGQAAVQQNPDQQFRQTRLTSTIDDIEIPQGLLEYIQFYFEGHAVTKAEKINRGGNQLYRLRVDRDDVPNDYSSFLLVFDMEWKFLNFEKQAPPPAPKPPKNPVKDDKKPAQDNRGQGNDDSEEPDNDIDSEPDAADPPDDEEPDGDETGGEEIVEPTA